ncbi:MAG TPA: glycerol-3-phosphate 1-O-acyltransferase PlsY [Candidatus Acidoferrum sp.]|jgi:glycerol-3-phosphate acyltransferase PlsY|nr:glycerol-3-phosphate 1-O-acyltransferase PlsY [Candidatus Acidoferrum sp.]
MVYVSPVRLVLLLGLAYLLGSIPVGLILAKLFAGSDIRKSGSGNIGATNVARVIGPVAGILTLILDVAKGALAVLLGGPFTEHSATAAMLLGMAALLGHCFPVWLKFKGGKGVAPALGVFLMLAPLAALGALLVFILVSVAWRYVSLGSVSAAAAMPLLMYFLWAPGHAPPLVVDFGTLFAAALVIFKHDANLQRLVDGTEPKFSFGSSKGDAA